MGAVIGAIVAATLLVWFVFVIFKDVEGTADPYGKAALVILAIIMVALVLYGAVAQ